MEIITATALSSQQKELVQELFRACREFEGMTLTFPAEDGDFFVLCMENGTLASALALYYLEPHLYECTAATRPDMRKQGYFSKALAQAELHFPNSDFSFVTDGRCPASAFVLKKLNARFWYNEHMMTLELSQWQPPVCALPSSFSMTVDERWSILTPPGFSLNIFRYKAFISLPPSPKEPVFVNIFSGSTTGNPHACPSSEK